MENSAARYVQRIELNVKGREKTPRNELYYDSLFGDGYLKVRRTSKTGEESVRLYAFDGVNPTIYRDEATGRNKTVCMALKEYVEESGFFMMDDTRAIPRNRLGIGLEEVLYALYYGEEIDKQYLKSLNVSAGITRGLANHIFEYHDVLGLDELRGPSGERLPVTLLWKETLYSNKVGAVHRATNKGTTDSCIYHLSGDVMVISHDGTFFYTEWDETLVDILGRIGSRVVSDGALKFVIDNVHVPFSAIIHMYRTSRIGEETMPEDIKRIYSSDFTSKRLEVDHLTENKFNNFGWALALMPRRVNSRMRNWRSHVKHPYYFFTVFDEQAACCKVQCGVTNDNVVWNKQFLFDWSNVKIGAERYKSCFIEFWEKLPKEYKLVEPSDLSKLHFWADPAKASEEDNPMIQMIHLLESEYEEYCEGVFVEMPVID